MTDRYLFRGKRIDGGEWVIGHLAMWECGRSEIWGHEKNNELYRFIIDPATIGQCTGLYDKNDSLIFEGDIILLSGKREVEGIVIWKAGQAGFLIAVAGKPIYAVVMARMSGEIVGNIHDNPELLPEGAK